MKLFDIFGFAKRRAAARAERKRRAVECSDLMDLADMYGEARYFGDAELMAVINDRMTIVMREQGLTSKEGASHG